MVVLPELSRPIMMILIYFLLHNFENIFPKKLPITEGLLWLIIYNLISTITITRKDHMYSSYYHLRFLSR